MINFILTKKYFREILFSYNNMSGEFEPFFKLIDFIIYCVDFLDTKYKMKIMDKYPTKIKTVELQNMSLYTIHEVDEEGDTYDIFFDEYVFL